MNRYPDQNMSSMTYEQKRMSQRQSMRDQIFKHFDAYGGSPLEMATNYYYQMQQDSRRDFPGVNNNSNNVENTIYKPQLYQNTNPINEYYHDFAYPSPSSPSHSVSSSNGSSMVTSPQVPSPTVASAVKYPTSNINTSPGPSPNYQTHPSMNRAQNSNTSGYSSPATSSMDSFNSYPSYNPSTPPLPSSQSHDTQDWTSWNPRNVPTPSPGSYEQISRQLPRQGDSNLQYEVNERYGINEQYKPNTGLPNYGQPSNIASPSVPSGISDRMKFQTDEVVLPAVYSEDDDDDRESAFNTHHSKNNHQNGTPVIPPTTNRLDYPSVGTTSDLSASNTIQSHNILHSSPNQNVAHKNANMSPEYQGPKSVYNVSNPQNITSPTHMGHPGSNQATRAPAEYNNPRRQDQQYPPERSYPPPRPNTDAIRDNTHRASPISTDHQPQKPDQIYVSSMTHIINEVNDVINSQAIPHPLPSSSTRLAATLARTDSELYSGQSSLPAPPVNNATKPFSRKEKPVPLDFPNHANSNGNSPGNTTMENGANNRNISNVIGAAISSPVTPTNANGYYAMAPTSNSFAGHQNMGSKLGHGPNSIDPNVNPVIAENSPSHTNFNSGNNGNAEVGNNRHNPVTSPGANYRNYQSNPNNNYNNQNTAHPIVTSKPKLPYPEDEKYIQLPEVPNQQGGRDKNSKPLNQHYPVRPPSAPIQLPQRSKTPGTTNTGNNNKNSNANNYNNGFPEPYRLKQNSRSTPDLHQHKYNQPPVPAIPENLNSRNINKREIDSNNSGHEVNVNKTQKPLGGVDAYGHSVNGQPPTIGQSIKGSGGAQVNTFSTNNTTNPNNINNSNNTNRHYNSNNNNNNNFNNYSKNMIKPNQQQPPSRYPNGNTVETTYTAPAYSQQPQSANKPSRHNIPGADTKPPPRRTYTQDQPPTGAFDSLNIDEDDPNGHASTNPTTQKPATGGTTKTSAAPQGQTVSTGPLTIAGFEALRQRARIGKESDALQLELAKRLVEACTTLANKYQDPNTPARGNGIQDMAKGAHAANSSIGNKNDNGAMNASENGMADNSRTTVDLKTERKNQAAWTMQAHKIVKKLSGHGYAPAMFFLASNYGSGGLGCEVDYEKAYDLYYKSATKHEHAESAYRTAVCNEIGAGTKRDPQRAIFWYRKAAKLGDVSAMYKLGMISLNGLLEQRQSFQEGVMWLQKAADNADEQNPHAVHELGLLYERADQYPGNYTTVVSSGGATGLSEGATVTTSTIGARVLEKDEKRAFELFLQAAELNYPPSQFRLGCCYEYGTLGCPIDPKRSITWYGRAAEKGEPESELALSGWYLTGSAGVLVQSDTEAYLWAKRAAEKGLSKAEYAVGYYTEVGIGVKSNIEEAKKWYFKAAAQRHPKALARLQEIRNGRR